MTKTFSNQDRFTFFAVKQSCSGLSLIELLGSLALMSESDRAAMNQANETYHLSIGCTIEHTASGAIVVTFPD
jgi:hypothetical protein